MHGGHWFGHAQHEPERQECRGDASVPAATHGRNVTREDGGRQSVSHFQRSRR
jgi:hypothetical protein